MTHKQLVKNIAESTGLTLDEVHSVLRELQTQIKQGIAETGEFKLLNIVSFKEQVRKAHKGTDPRNGQSIDIPEKTVIKAKASSLLYADS